MRTCTCVCLYANGFHQDRTEAIESGSDPFVKDVLVVTIIYNAPILVTVSRL